MPHCGVPSASQHLQNMGYVTLICLVFAIRSNSMFIPTLYRRHVAKKSMAANEVDLSREQLSENVPFSDSRDEWLDKTLFRQIGTTGNFRRESKFQTTDMVVAHFLSPHENQVVDFPLRRIHTFNHNCKEGEEMHYSTELFDLLFGPCKNVSDHAHTIRNCKNMKQAKSRRANLRVTLAYRGLDFCGWEDQRHHLYRREVFQDVAISNQHYTSKQNFSLPSVQGTLVDILDPILNKRAIAAPSPAGNSSERAARPIEIKVAGRTDAGVNAIAQTCRIRTRTTDISEIQTDPTKPIDILETFVKDVVNEHAEKNGLGLRITSVEKVGDDFHPTFGASCRAYAYFIDLDDAKEGITSQQPRIMRELVQSLDSMLRSLEGRSLDYIAFSYGKVKTQTTICRLVHARACIVKWNQCERENLAKEAICIELVGDRFLRRMVRILVATALREAYGIKGNPTDYEEEQGLGNETNNQLLNIVKMRDRSHCARAAPAGGLIFVGAGY